MITDLQEPEVNKSVDHEKWNERMAQRFNPDAFITKTGFLIRWMEALRIKKSVQLLHCHPDDVILDLGCGAGNITLKLMGKKIYGIDLSDSLLTMAHQRCDALKNVEIKKGNAEDLQFPDSTFTKIICSEVLEHVRDPQKALSEIHRVSKPGGQALITVPNEDLINQTKKIVLKLGLKKWVAGEYNMSDNMLDEWHVSEITREWMTSHVGDKFKLEKILSIPFGFFPYHRAFNLTIKK